MTLFQARLEKIKARNIQVGEECMDNMEDDEEKDVLIFDIGGGINITIKKENVMFLNIHLKP